jgi:hypothetical protein
MENLAALYASGRGVAKNDAEAARWYRKAAEKGSSTAMSKLGDMYAQGRGVAKNDAEAARWYRWAAEEFKKDADAAYDDWW